MNDTGALLRVDGNVVQGTQAASGTRHLSHYGGTIALQKRFFDCPGLDCTGVYNGTINVTIAPFSFHISHPCVELKNVQWHPERPEVSETFWFIDCTLEFRNLAYGGYFYYPHPSTKVGKFPGYQIMEILCPFVNGISYGERVSLYLPREHVTLISSLPGVSEQQNRAHTPALSNTTN